MQSKGEVTGDPRGRPEYHQNIPEASFTKPRHHSHFRVLTSGRALTRPPPR